MITYKTLFAFVAMASIALSGATKAADEKSYRASGSILHMTATDVTLRTTTQDLELTKDAKTKVTGAALKVGAMATVIYTKPGGRAYATEIQVKAKDR